MAYESFQTYRSESVAGDDRRKTLQPRCYGPPAPEDVKVTIIVDMVLMGESVFFPTDPSEEEREVQKFFLEVIEMVFTILFTGGSIKDFPGIGQYGSVYGRERDDSRWFKRLRQVLDAADNGEEPANGRHNDSSGSHAMTLRNWIVRNRWLYDNNNLYKERREEFDRIGFMQMDLGSRPAKAAFDNMFNVFKRFERANNFCYPPMSLSSCANSLERKLCKWVSNLQQALRSFRNGGGNDYQQHKVQKLNSIGFVWYWQKEYKHLMAVTSAAGSATPLGPIQKFF